jgi:hypothetical protein
MWETGVSQRMLPLSNITAHSGNSSQTEPFLIDDGIFDQPSPHSALSPPPTPPQDSNMLRDGEGGVSGGALTVVPGSKAGQMLAVGEEQCRLAFRVTVNTNFGEEVFLCGSAEVLGEWVPQKGLRLATNKELYPDWIGKVDCPVRYRSLLLLNRCISWSLLTLRTVEEREEGAHIAGMQCQ